MKINTFKIAAIIFILTILLPINACTRDNTAGQNNASDTAIVVVAGTHNNSEQMDIASYLDAKLEDVFKNFGEIRVVVVDANPEVAVDENGIPLGYYSSLYIEESMRAKDKNEPKWEKDYLRSQMQTMGKNLRSLSPNDSEVDTLAALFEARELLYSMKPESSSKEIIVFDTGLCTAGAMNFLDEDMSALLFSHDKLEAERIRALVSSLADKAELPDLSGIRVIWYGLGKVAEPQEALSRLNESNLQAIWTEVLRQCNAEMVNANIGEKDSYFGFSTSYGKTCYDMDVTPVIDWSEKIIVPLTGFVNNSSELSDLDNAKTVLEPCANNLKKIPTIDILLVGTTADPKKNGGDAVLSKQRAEVVKDILVQLGISESRIRTLGWGAKAPLYHEDEWDGDVFVEDVAATNRSVVIMPIQSDLAQTLLKEGSE